MGWQGEYSFPGYGSAFCILTAGHVLKNVRDAQTALALLTPNNIAVIIANSSQLANSSYSFCSMDTPIPNDPHVYEADYGLVRTDIINKSNSILFNNAYVQAFTYKKASDYYYSLLEGKTVFKGDGATGVSMGTIDRICIDDEVADSEFGTEYVMNTIRVKPLLEGSYNRAFSGAGDSGCTVFAYIDEIPVVLGIVVIGPEDITTVGASSYFTTLSFVMERGFTPNAATL